MSTYERVDWSIFATKDQIERVEAAIRYLAYYCGTPQDALAVRDLLTSRAGHESQREDESATERAEASASE